MSRHFKPKTGFKKGMPKTVLITVDGVDISLHHVVSVVYKKIGSSADQAWAFSNYKGVLKQPTQATLDLVPSDDTVEEEEYDKDELEDVEDDDDGDEAASGNLTIVLQDPVSTTPEIPVTEDVEVS